MTVSLSPHPRPADASPEPSVHTAGAAESRPERRLDNPPLPPRLPGWRGTFAWALVRSVRPR